MKHVSKLIACLMISTNPALADGFQGFYGGFGLGPVGGQVGGKIQGDFLDYLDGVTTIDESENPIHFGDYGADLFAGFNVQSGSMVFGLEGRLIKGLGSGLNGSFSDHNDSCVPDVTNCAHYSYEGENSYSIENLQELRARIGYVNDALLLYIAGGITNASSITADYTATFYDASGNFSSSNSESYTVSASGYNLGIGFEYNIGAHIFTGMDYTVRRLHGDIAEFGDVGGFDFNADEVSIRLGARF